MKKRTLLMLLAATLMLGSLAGCRRNAPKAEESPAVDVPVTVPTQQVESQAPLTLTVAQDVPQNVGEYRDTAAVSCDTIVVLTANQSALSLRLTTVDPDSLALGETLYASPTLAKGESLVVFTYVNDTIPNRGVLCTDQEGNTYAYHITYSGRDGSICLTPVEESSYTEPIPVELMTADEMAKMQDFLNEISNNGLVGSLNLYDAPSRASLGEMFYQGAGISDQDWEEGEMQALLAATGWEELYTSVTKVPAMGVQQQVLDKLGLELGEMASTMEQEGFVYLEAYDAYYHMHGDTNYAAVTVVDGMKSADGTYYVQYQLDGFPGDVYKVTLKKTENGLHFVSNVRL